MRKWPLRACVLVLSMVAAFAGSAAAQTPDTTLTVVTYNIRYANPKDGENVWENRRDAMAAYLRQTGADLIGVQEAEPAQRAWLAEQLTDYGWYGVGRNAEHDQGEGTPVFYRLDRFDVLDRGTFWLSTTPDIPGSRGWDAALPRVASWLKLRDRRTGSDFLIVNTHFDHVGQEARRESAHLLTRRIDALVRPGDQKLPVILMGDFNSRQSDAPYAAITRSPDPALALVDAQHVSRTLPTGGDSTSNGFKAINPGAKIDYVFLRDVTVVQSHDIQDPRVDGRFVSDHQPVVVRLELPVTPR